MINSRLVLAAAFLLPAAAWSQTDLGRAYQEAREAMTSSREGAPDAAREPDGAQQRAGRAPRVGDNIVLRVHWAGDGLRRPWRSGTVVALGTLPDYVQVEIQKPYLMGDSLYHGWHWREDIGVEVEGGCFQGLCVGDRVRYGILPVTHARVDKVYDNGYASISGQHTDSVVELFGDGIDDSYGYDIHRIGRLKKELASPSNP